MKGVWRNLLQHNTLYSSATRLMADRGMCGWRKTARQAGAPWGLLL
ncbi:hypothetical protein [Dickeya dianthicola]|nr:hypothetical protein [Dickeya dianthicola]ATO31403.1 hypothetical protein DDI_0235 [Dickeya dianthicola RNS04.9]MBT1426580.1 hypothetical protein [Dickeya dianthicola]MBT1430634.1 hypothetical protein [Dickeya dianthicola]MBT1458103.1 hypothetical protein [Dickeya dianthicola]MBT1487241.1 hypothetical protein [Dickeya dianthicola]